MKYASSKSIFKGIVSFIPYSAYFYRKIKKPTAHSGSNARYCYSLWLRMLVLLSKFGYSLENRDIAELGNSSSFGLGLAALICGARSYSSLEIVRFEKNEMIEKNQKILNELISLFQSREDIPDDSEFPKINIKLDSYEFPFHILPDSKLESLLSTNRLEQIKYSLDNFCKKEQQKEIRCFVPWEKNHELEMSSFDFIFSRATMEHVANPEKVYFKLGRLLRKECIMLHDIDYHSHRIGKEWNSHWCISDFIWFLIKGRNIGIINRLSHEMHRNLISGLDYDILFEKRTLKPSKISSSCLSKAFQNIPTNDLTTCGGYFLLKNN
jgi:hypothetical protein